MNCNYFNFSKADKLFHNLNMWIAVPERDRKEIYEDVLFELAKKEKEQSKQLRNRNIKALKKILENIPKITYKTHWNEAQKLLFKDTNFAQDIELQNMDKEDALIVYEEHIRFLEHEHEQDLEKQKCWLRRQERKHREVFTCYLDELHEKGIIISTSRWVDCYSLIGADEKFTNILGQTGKHFSLTAMKYIKFIKCKNSIILYIF